MYRFLFIVAALGACAESSQYNIVEGPASDLVDEACSAELNWYEEKTGFTGSCPSVTWVAPPFINADGEQVGGETASPSSVIVVWRSERSIAMSTYSHELLHALEWQRTGDPDHYHTGDLWGQLPEINCFFRDLDPVCDGGELPPVCPLCGR